MSAAVLVRVIYDLFEFEADLLDRPESDSEHAIDREVRLELSNGGTNYVSWSSKPVQYCIGVQERSFFNPGDAVSRDASDHRLWRRIVGAPVEFVVLDDAHQVLEIRSPTASVFLSSQERGVWQADTVTVSAQRPETKR